MIVYNNNNDKALNLALHPINLESTTEIYFHLSTFPLSSLLDRVEGLKCLDAQHLPRHISFGLPILLLACFFEIVSLQTRPSLGLQKTCANYLSCPPFNSSSISGPALVGIFLSS